MTPEAFPAPGPRGPERQPPPPNPGGRPEWPAEALRPRDDFPAWAESQGGAAMGACFGCKKCGNGCPLTFAMDLPPHQVVRLAQLGQLERLEASRTIWVCASCQTCLTRCPNQVDLPRFMDWLKERLAPRGGLADQRRTLLFHQLFLRQIKARGRVFEGSLMARYLVNSGGAWGPEALANARLGWALFKRGRLRLTPKGIKDRRWLRALFKGRGGAKHAT